jgi:hypothetical protein
MIRRNRHLATKEFTSVKKICCILLSSISIIKIYLLEHTAYTYLLLLSRRSLSSGISHFRAELKILKMLNDINCIHHLLLPVLGQSPYAPLWGNRPQYEGEVTRWLLWSLWPSSLTSQNVCSLVSMWSLIPQRILRRCHSTALSYLRSWWYYYDKTMLPKKDWKFRFFNVGRPVKLQHLLMIVSFWYVKSQRSHIQIHILNQISTTQYVTLLIRYSQKFYKFFITIITWAAYNEKLSKIAIISRVQHNMPNISVHSLM